jgi:drug/metabolite transporter (DMT)-like permease
VLVFSSNNALGKWTIGTIPVGEFLFVRGLLALVLLSPFYWRAGLAPIRAAPRKGLQLARMLLSSIEIAMFYWALSYLPLADTMTFWLATPIYVTALSALLLGEKVGWRRWTAVTVGFFGVVLAMRPSGATFGWPALIGVTGSILYAFVLIATRSLRSTSDIVLVSGSLAGSTIFGLVMMSFGFFVMPSAIDLGVITVIAILFIVGAVLSNRSLRLAPASVVVPFQYTQIIWGVLFGYLVFGDVPAITTLVGAAIITGAGIYIFMRERAVSKREPMPIEPP